MHFHPSPPSPPLPLHSSRYTNFLEWLRRPAHHPALLPAHQLRVDALRGFLFAHGACLGVCVREETGALPALAGMGRPRVGHFGVRTAAGLSRERERHDAVSCSCLTVGGSVSSVSAAAHLSSRVSSLTPPQVLDERDHLHKHSRRTCRHINGAELVIPL